MRFAHSTYLVHSKRLLIILEGKIEELSKKLAAVICCMLFLQLLLPFTSSAKRIDLADVNPTYWAFSSINEMVENGYMRVFEGGTFKPQQSSTRAEVAETIVKVLQLPLDATIQLKATDVQVTHPQYEAFRKLVELNIFDNREQLHPEQFVTRSQMAKIIALAFQIVVDEKNESAFNDTRHCWAKHYIESLADVGVITGKSNGSYGPYDNVTRAQLAILLTRALDFKKQVENLEVAYDYLGKMYITTLQEHELWVKKTIQLVNEEREKQSLSPLIQDPFLNQLAIIKVQDILEHAYFDHKSPYYGHPWDMATLYDYEFSSLGENIARYLSTPEEAMKAWMASDTHRENMLKPTYTHMGVAIKKDDNGRNYWVQLFSSK